MTFRADNLTGDTSKIQKAYCQMTFLQFKLKECKNYDRTPDHNEFPSIIDRVNIKLFFTRPSKPPTVASSVLNTPNFHFHQQSNKCLMSPANSVVLIALMNTNSNRK